MKLENDQALNGLVLISKRYLESGCANQPVLCGECATPSFGYCSPDGRCLDSWAIGAR